MLVFNRVLTAQEAYERNLVTEVIPDAEFQLKSWKKIEEISKLPKEVSFIPIEPEHANSQ